MNSKLDAIIQDTICMWGSFGRLRRKKDKGVKGKTAKGRKGNPKITFAFFLPLFAVALFLFFTTKAVDSFLS